MLKYFPVLGPATYLTHYEKTRDPIMEWWNAVGKDYYIPRIGLSYPYHKNIPDVRKFFRCREEVEVMCDSGGFEIYKKGIKLDPVTVLSWQLNNADIGFILDYPPVNNEDYDRCIRMTLNSVEISVKWLEKRESDIKDSRFRFYSVIHGNISNGQFENWFKLILYQRGLCRFTPL